MPEYAVSNLLKVIKRFGNNKLVTFTSRNEWNSLPEKLTVTHEGQDYGQKIKQHAFYTDERASLGFVFNKVLLSLEAGVSGYFRNLDTNLFGVDRTDVTETEALTTDYLRVFASPKFEWSYKKLELTLNLPVNLYSYFFPEPWVTARSSSCLLRWRQGSALRPECRSLCVEAPGVLPPLCMISTILPYLPITARSVPEWMITTPRPDSLFPLPTAIEMLQAGYS